MHCGQNNLLIKILQKGCKQLKKSFTEVSVNYRDTVLSIENV